MAHTVMAATVFPLFKAVYALYDEEGAKTARFGKALFMGMACVAGAGIITLLGTTN